MGPGVVPRARATDARDRATLLNVEEHLTQLKERHEEAFREYRTLGVTLPGAARARLQWATGCLNPAQVRPERDTADLALAREREDLAEMLHEPTKRRLLTGGPGTEILVQARRDAELLREELVLALGRSRARAGRLAHFVEKMSRYHAARLLRAFSGRGARAAETELATALAEHFFDGGIAASADASFLDRASLFVQVRHVPKPTLASVRAAIALAQKGLARVAETRGALRGVLVVVSHAGPRVVLPQEVHASGRAGPSLLLGALHVGSSRGGGKELHVSLVDESAD